MARKTRSKAKSNSILNFVAVTFLAIVGIVLSFCSFNIPFTTNVYNGFANAIPLGIDFVGGISVSYDCSVSVDSNTSDLNTAIDATVARLQNVISKEDGYEDVEVSKQGNNIRIQVPSITDASLIYELSKQTTPLRITLEEDGETRMSAEDVSLIIATQQQETNGSYAYGVALNFNTAGKDKFSALTKEAADGSQKLYIYLGEDLFQELSCTEQITNGSVFISGSFDSYELAENYANQLKSGVYSANLSLSSTTVIPAVLGERALTLSLIGGGIAVLLIMILLWVRYGEFGFLVDYAFLFGVILMVFFMQAVPGVELLLTSLAGIALSIILLFGGAVVILEKIRADYRQGMKIPVAVKSGLKRSLWPVLDSHLIIVIFGVIMCLLGSVELQQFAFVLLIGTLVSLFVNLVVLRFFIKWYLPFNSVKAKKLHLPKQIKHVKENEEIIIGGQANE